MLKKILKRADVKEFLHEILTDERIISKVSPLDPDDKAYPEAEYNLIIAMDALIKYTILFDSDDLIDEYVIQLRRLMKKCENHRDIANGILIILTKITAVTIKVQDMESDISKRKILSYIYKRYITNGYCYHAFPSIYYNDIRENGIDPEDYKYYKRGLERINEIFALHNKKDIFFKDYLDESYITITDSASLAYHYAFASPKYLSDLTATSTYMDNAKLYDNGAYFKNDFKVAEANIEQLCRDFELTNSEAKEVLETFVTEWKRLDVTRSRPTIAFIKRKAVNKNYLKDYRNILDTSSKEELIYSVNRIFESRVADEKRYTPLNKEEITLVKLPNYKEILYNDTAFVEELEEKEEEKIKEEVPSVINLRNEVVNAYGSASIFALFGVLLITLGATITILLAAYKG